MRGEGKECDKALESKACQTCAFRWRPYADRLRDCCTGKLYLICHFCFLCVVKKMRKIILINNIEVSKWYRSLFWFFELCQCMALLIFFLFKLWVSVWVGGIQRMLSAQHGNSKFSIVNIPSDVIVNLLPRRLLKRVKNYHVELFKLFIYFLATLSLFIQNNNYRYY